MYEHVQVIAQALVSYFSWEAPEITHIFKLRGQQIVVLFGLVVATQSRQIPARLVPLQVRAQDSWYTSFICVQSEQRGGLEASARDTFV